MQNGIIVKGIGGFYYVDIGSKIIECKAQGHFRNKKLTPCVGDRVNIEIAPDDKGSICEIFERKNIFVRPPVSNIDLLVIVVSLKNPEPDLCFLDKMLVIAQLSDVDTLICFNKADLDDQTAKHLSQIYINAGYKVAVTSALNSDGINDIKKYTNGKITAFCGFSGAGKSSLLNCVTGLELMQTGEISKRLKRGKHTTRHVELIKFNSGYIVDTPGFSMLDFPTVLKKEALADYFPEFSDFVLDCKFRDCAHNGTESVCAVCAATRDGHIAESRYKNYLEFYKTLSQRKEW